MKLRHFWIAFAILSLSASSDLWGQAKEPPAQEQSIEKRKQPEPRSTEKPALAENDKQEAQSKADDDHKMVGYTLDLVFVGIVQLFVFILQLIAFSVQARYMRRTVTEMRKTTHATIRSTRTAERAAIATQVAADAAIDTERAFLFPIIGRDNTDVVTRGATLDDASGKLDAHVAVLYKIKNYGKTPAIIKEVSIQISHCKELEKEREFEPIIPMPFSIILSGADETSERGCSMDNLLSNADARSIKEAGSSLWLYGYLSYDDVFGWGRELNFVWQYNGDTGGFSLFHFREHKSREKHQDT